MLRAECQIKPTSNHSSLDQKSYVLMPQNAQGHTNKIKKTQITHFTVSFILWGIKDSLQREYNF